MEMNMHIGQNVLAETELRNLAAIPYQIISPANNGPIIGIYQDSLLGSYRFTRNEIVLNPREAMNLLMMYNKVNPATLFANGGRVTNFDVLSQIMPPLTLKYKTKLWDNDANEDPAISNNVLEIRNGKYIRGQIEKSVLGGGSKGIIQRVCNDFGNRNASDFIDDLQNVITEYMKRSSYSVGVSDLMSNRETSSQITEIIKSKKLEVAELIQKVHTGIFENNTSHSNKMEFETQVNNILNDATKNSDKVSRKSLNQNNRFLMIVNSGSKGTLINISHMISCLGQVNVDGKRVPYGFDSRTLPHFSKFDDSPGARGFIENSYINGLTASELFFHAMGGRVGLIDTAVKTSQTGYIQRRLIKGLEDLKVEYDMTVRNSKGKIIQFAYGDDGFDPMKTESQSIPLVSMSTQDIYMHYDVIGASVEDRGISLVYTKGAASRIKKQRDETMKACKTYIDKMIAARDRIVDRVFRNKDDSMVVIPVDFVHTINNMQGSIGLSSNSLVDITPMEAMELIEEYFQKIKGLYYVPPTDLFEVMYFFYLNPRELLNVKRFHREGLILLLETVLLKYKQAIVHPGEMVGVVAGQSIGEPTTQMTLNTFHLAGVASKSNVTRGVPRIEEILRLTSNPKNPSLTVFLKPVDEDNAEKAKQFANMMEHTKLADLVKSVNIHFDPDDRNTNIVEDRTFIEQYYAFANAIGGCDGAETVEVNAPKSKWIIRMEMDTEVLLDKNITMDDIHFAIRMSSFGNEHMDCLYSDYNSDKLVFRLRINENFGKDKKRKGTANPLDQTDEIYLLKKYQDEMLNGIVLRGVQGIENVIPRQLQNVVSKQDGKYAKKDTWILDTTGTNLLETLALDFIDNKRTFSNDIKEIFDVLGIEAARQVIHNELVEVMEFSGAYINYHHISLLCDRMTCNKDMVSIFRTGLFSDDIGPIAKATFEVHTEVLLDAARFGEFDTMRGVSANVMCGQPGYYGTNAFQLVLDMEAMANVSANEANTEDADEEIERLLNSYKGEDQTCGANKLDFRNNTNNVPSTNPGICNDGYDIGF